MDAGRGGFGASFSAPCALFVSCCRSPRRRDGLRPASAAATSSRGVPTPQGGTWQQLREQEAVQPGHPGSPALPWGTAATPQQWRCGNGRMNLAGGGRTEGTSAATLNRFFRPLSRRAGVRARGLSAASLWDMRIPSWLPMSSTSQA